jgi:hypothetical protein
MRERLAEETEIEERDARGRRVRKKVSYLEAFVLSQIRRAVSGDSQAARNVWERIEGKVALEVGGTEQGEPIRFVIDKEMEGI